MNIEEIRGEDDKLPSYAWPGGYQILYLCRDGGTLCPACANENADLHGDENDPQWYIEAYFVNWEGPDTICDNCNARFESEYGETE